MTKTNSMQLENEYKISQNLMKRNKYIQVVIHLEKVLRNVSEEDNKEILKNMYEDIIKAYKAINNKTRAEYYSTKALGLFNNFSISEATENKSNQRDETSLFQQEVALMDESNDEVFLENENSDNLLKNDNEYQDTMEENISDNIEAVAIDTNWESKEISEDLGENIMYKTVDDFELISKKYKINGSGVSEVAFNNIFGEISTAVESKRYFGYFKLNLNKLNEILYKDLNNLDKKDLNKLRWETKKLLSLIEDNVVTSFEMLFNLEFTETYNTNLMLNETIGDYNAVDSTNVDSRDNTSDFWNDSQSLKTNNENSEIQAEADSIDEENSETLEEQDDYLDTKQTAETLSQEAEIMSMEEASVDLNMEENFSSAENTPNETIIVEIKSDIVRENNLEVSTVKDVVLEVLENLRKADLDIFAELKDQSENRAQQVGIEKEKKGLLSGLEGMLEIKFGIASLDIVPEMKKIDKLDRLYEVKEKILETRSFVEVERLVENSINE